MPDLERVQQATPFTLAHQWTEGGVAVDPGTVTIGITGADGTVIVSPGTSTNGLATAPRTFLLTTTHTALLDVAKVTWTSTLKGTLQSYIEIVGGFLCSLGDIEAVFPAADVAEQARIRMACEQRLERAIGARVPRYAYERHHARRRLRVSHGPLRSVRSLAVDGYAYGQTTLDALILADSTIFHSFGRGSLYGQVTIGYEYGLDYPDETVREAMKLVAAETFDTSSDGRVIRREADGQAVTYASPSSGGGFLDPTLRAMVRDLAGPLVA